MQTQRVKRGERETSIFRGKKREKRKQKLKTELQLRISVQTTEL